MVIGRCDSGMGWQNNLSWFVVHKDMMAGRELGKESFLSNSTR